MTKNIKKIVYPLSFTNTLLNVGNKLKIKSPKYYISIAGINIIKIAKNWPEILKWYKSHNTKEINIKMRNELSFVCFGPADLSMFTEIWAIQEYNPKGLDIKKDNTIIDIGAHVGFFSIYAAYNAKYGKVYSYEPFKNNYQTLIKNISRNKIKNIKAYNMAVASTSGKRTFYISSEHNGCHSLFQRSSKNKKIVKTTSLNDIMIRNNIKVCDFLKMDCEGAEVEILCNASPETLNKIKVIAGELHSDLLTKKEIEKMFKYLNKNNFSIMTKNGLFFALKK